MTDTVIVLRGKLHWARLMGAPRPHTGNPKYDKGPYWSTDLTPDEKSLELMKKFGITDKLRDPEEIRRKAKKQGKESKEDRKEDFISLKVLQKKKDGSNNNPPKIIDIHGNKWPEGKLLGNETIADLKVKIVDYGSASEKGVYLQATRVLDHVPYESDEFETLSEDDEYFAKATEAKTAGEDEAPVGDDELDDDVPF